MKTFFFILSFFFLGSPSLLAQEDDDVDDNATIRDKMSEFIQKRLNLTNEEAKQFKPIFINYFNDWKKTARENRGDNLVMKQKITELQLKYRERFRTVIGEERSNRIFTHQHDFIKVLRELRQERLQNNPGRRATPRRGN